ncbi:MAG TPA: NfeD family protein [Gemmatimonadales bacterium]|nr:NfeD family protein [Gemmatimonadales bacterium]
MRRLLSAVLVAAVATSLAAQERPVYRVPVTGTIELGLAPFVARSIREAQRANARAVVLVLDTPGGRIDAAERISDAVRDATVPVYALIDRRAFSAGAMIALATDSIFMRSGGVIGAATPVSGQTGERLPEKYVSAMRAEFRALAEDHGIDPRLAEGMVDENLDIPGIKPRGQLLTLSTDEAVRLGVARGGEVVDLERMLSALGLGGAPVVSTSANWAEGLVRFLSNPVVAPLLMSLGMLGLIMELKTPGFGLAGATGLVLMALFFGSHWIVGLAGWLEVILIVAGLAALAAEIFVLPGFGIAGFLGLGSIGAGFFLAMIGSYPTAADLWGALAGVGVGLVIFVALLVAFLRHLPASKRLGGILHREGIAAAEGYISAPVRSELVGRHGKAISELRPAGVAEIGGERVDVTTEGEFIAPGTEITVVRAEAMRLVVRRAGQA